MATTNDGYRNLSAFMTGSQEVPGPGDTDGWGLANVRVWPATGKVCYTMFVRHIGTATAAHIHVGKRGVAGDHKVDLTLPVLGWAAGCADVTPATAAKIAASPKKYYVNIHTSEFPDGAIRGQLRAAPGR
jgi:hypothetical protein